MIIFNLSGGLGNQMFQYACGCSISLQLCVPVHYITDSFGEYGSHNGFELERVFGLKLQIADRDELAQVVGRVRSHPAVRRAFGKMPFPFLSGPDFILEPHFHYWPELIDKLRQGGYVQGYWQSASYFERYSAAIREDFTFCTELSPENQRIARKIEQCNAVSIHVRRGDYVSNRKTLALHGVCSPDYYRHAIESILSRVPDARLFAFTDDPQWVREVLMPEYPELHLVDFNNGVESYNDMRLMSLCRHHIVANSSFSWWGAWLNAREDKVVIAPKQWFSKERNTKDLIPASWERL